MRNFLCRWHLFCFSLFFYLCILEKFIFHDFGEEKFHLPVASLLYLYFFLFVFVFWKNDYFKILQKKKKIIIWRWHLFCIWIWFFLCLYFGEMYISCFAEKKSFIIWRWHLLIPNSWQPKASLHLSWCFWWESWRPLPVNCLAFFPINIWICICIYICILYLQKLYLVGQVSLRGLCTPTALYKSVAPQSVFRKHQFLVHSRIILSEKYALWALCKSVLIEETVFWVIDNYFTAILGKVQKNCERIAVAIFKVCTKELQISLPCSSSC